MKIIKKIIKFTTNYRFRENVVLLCAFDLIPRDTKNIEGDPQAMFRRN